MNTWRREVSPPKSVLTLSVVVAALLVPLLMLLGQYKRQWTPLERQYLLTYLFTDEAGTGQYRLLTVRYPTGRRMALDGDIIPAAATSGIPPQYVIPFALSEQAKHVGARSLEWEWFQQTDRTKLHEWLQQNIYQGQSVGDLIKRPLEQGAIFLLILLPLAIYHDRKRLRQLKEGQLVRGPELVSRSRFNHTRRANGIGFTTADQPGLWERLLGRKSEGSMVRVPRHEENKHVLLMGDSGSGKTSLIRQILLQLRARGDTAVVFDSTLAFTSQFYDPAHRDRILNPVDERMAYWTPSDEVRYVPEALTLAESLFPEPPNQDPFFVQAAQRIFARLLRYRPSPEDLARWMSHWEEIDRRVAGTEVVAMLERSAAPQRAAVQSTFNMVAAALRLLPSEDQAQGRWSAAEWARERQGWLFLTSTPMVAKQILPLTSLWLDSLLLRLMTLAEGGSRAVWIILDELASLQKLPQLAKAITVGRNFNLRLVVGFQGRSQIEAVYGLQTETMLSQPKTKIFLRTSEPRAAEWISQAIGDVEIERLKESRTDNIPVFFAGKRKSKTYHLERRVERLALASEITGLPDHSGYLKLENQVVRVKFPYVEAKRNQPGFVPRPLSEIESLPAPEEQPAAAAPETAHDIKPATSPARRPEQEPQKRQDPHDSKQQVIFD